MLLIYLDAAKLFADLPFSVFSNLDFVIIYVFFQFELINILLKKENINLVKKIQFIRRSMRNSSSQQKKNQN
jgi:ABC-type uncharacterized transport system permease subunit